MKQLNFGHLIGLDMIFISPIRGKWWTLGRVLRAKRLHASKFPFVSLVICPTSGLPVNLEPVFLDRTNRWKHVWIKLVNITKGQYCMGRWISKFLWDVEDKRQRVALQNVSLTCLDSEMRWKSDIRRDLTVYDEEMYSLLMKNKKSEPVETISIGITE